MSDKKTETIIKAFKILCIITAILCLLCLFALWYCYHQVSIADPVVEIGRKNALLEAGWFFVKFALSTFCISCGFASILLINKIKLKRNKKSTDTQNHEN